MLLGHKLCFYGNTVNVAWIIYRYIAFLSSWKLLGFVLKCKLPLWNRNEVLWSQPLQVVI